MKIVSHDIELFTYNMELLHSTILMGIFVFQRAMECESSNDLGVVSIVVDVSSS